MRLLRLFLCVLVAGLACCCGGAAAATAPAPAGQPGQPGQPGQSACEALMVRDFSGVEDAPMVLLKAALVPAAGAQAGYCEVQGYVNPNVGFGMRLPLENWNGKYLVHGCGGACGVVDTEISCKGLIEQGYACIQTDMGHKSQIGDGVWAYNNPQAMIDFGYRATHVTTLAGRALLKAFYTEPLRRSYYLGCSTGGRQGMVEAQRYPDDFDGIAVIGPVLRQSIAAMQLLWSQQVNRGADGQQILTAAKLPALSRAVVAACDMNDGLKDGLIGDPRQCHFDPKALLCQRGHDDNSCLSAAQAKVAQQIYDGPASSDGKLLTLGSAQRGSEAQWLHAFVLDGTEKPFNLLQDSFRYMLLDPAPGPSWQASRFNWDHDPQRVGTRDAFYDAYNPDLRPFKARGGKLLMLQGWSDMNVMPLNAVDYYETVTRLMGGPQSTRDFFRLFMVPGANHCSGGDGAWVVDTLTALNDWVESGKAPEVLIGTKPKDGTPNGGYLGSALPSTVLQPAFQRPYFPYPAGTVYDGKGDPDQAASFIAR